MLSLTPVHMQFLTPSGPITGLNSAAWETCPATHTPPSAPWTGTKRTVMGGSPESPPQSLFLSPETSSSSASCVELAGSTEKMGHHSLPSWRTRHLLPHYERTPPNPSPPELIHSESNSSSSYSAVTTTQVYVQVSTLGHRTPRTSQSRDSSHPCRPAILDQLCCIPWLHRYKPEGWGPGLHEADFLEGRHNKPVNRYKTPWWLRQ